MADHEQRDLVEDFLRMIDGVPRQKVEAWLGKGVSQSALSRFDNGTRTLSPAKARFLRDVLMVWREEGEPAPPNGVEVVGMLMGHHESERVKTLIRWLSHPDVLPIDTPWAERFRIGEAIMRIDAYNAGEVRQFAIWRDQTSKALPDDIRTQLAGRR